MTVQKPEQTPIFYRIPFYAVSQAMLIGLPILVSPFLIRILTPENYGFYEAGYAALLFLNGVVSLEISQGLQRLYPEYPESDRPRLIASASAYVFFAYFFTYIAVRFGIVAVGKESAVWAQWVSPFFVLGFSQSLFAVFSAYLRLEVSPIRFVRILIVYSLAFLIAHLVLFFSVKNGGTFDLTNVILLQSMIALFGCFVCAIPLFRSFNELPSRLDLKKMLHYSWPLGLATIPNYFLGVMEVAFIESRHGVEMVGRYAMAAKIATAVNLFAAATQVALIPEIFSNTLNPMDSLRRSLRNALSTFELLAIPLCVFLFFFSPELIQILFPEPGTELVLVFRILILSVFIGRLTVFYPGIEMKKKTSALFLIHLVQLGVALGFYFFLSQSYGLIFFAYVAFLLNLIRLVSVVFLSRAYLGFSSVRSGLVPVFILLGVLGFYALIASDAWNALQARCFLTLGVLGIYFSGVRAVRARI